MTYLFVCSGLFLYWVSETVLSRLLICSILYCENILHQSADCIDVYDINVFPPQRAHKYLVSKGKSSSNLRHFKSQLHLIWFHLYHRQRNTGWDAETSCQTPADDHVIKSESNQGIYCSYVNDYLIVVVSVIFYFLRYFSTKTFTSLDSCGFEHVFVGETKSGTEIIGFHNWIQFYLQEKNSHLDYKGYRARNHDLVSITVCQIK